MNNRNGISTFFYFAIPAVLALAALWWLAFGEGVRDFSNLLSQEKRTAEVTGALPLPTEPIKIVLVPHTRDPVVITRAWIDGGSVYLYYQNNGHEKATGITIEYKLVSPNGTVIGSSNCMAELSCWNGAGDLDPGEKSEAHGDIDADQRGATLKLIVTSNRADGFSDW